MQSGSAWCCLSVYTMLLSQKVRSCPPSSRSLIVGHMSVLLHAQLEQERRKSNGLAQALQRVKEQHFTTQQQVYPP